MAEALALITLTQRSHCDKPGVPYIGVEKDLAAFRRLDPNWISRNPYESNELASFAYWDEYYESDGFFPWINTEYIKLPRPPPTYKPHSNRHPLDNGLAWTNENLEDGKPKYEASDNTIARPSEAHVTTAIEPITASPTVSPKPALTDRRKCRAKVSDQFLFSYESTRKRRCRDRQVKRSSLLEKGRPDSNRDSTGHSANSDSDGHIVARVLDERANFSLESSQVTPVPIIIDHNIEQNTSAIIPLVEAESSSYGKEVYKLKGQVVGLIILSIIVVLMIARQSLAIWRNCLRRKNLRILLSDLASAENEVPQIMNEKSGVSCSSKITRLHLRSADQGLVFAIKSHYCFIVSNLIRIYSMLQVPEHIRRIKVWNIKSVHGRYYSGHKVKRTWSSRMQCEITDSPRPPEKAATPGHPHSIQFQAVKVELVNTWPAGARNSYERGDTIEILRTNSSTPSSVASTTTLAKEGKFDEYREFSEYLQSNRLDTFALTIGNGTKVETSEIIDEDPPPGFELSNDNVWPGSTRENPFDRIVNEPSLGTLLYNLIVGQDLSPSEVQLLLRIGDMN